MSEVVHKEIASYPETGDRWKDITINIGASQSTLQDIKLPETAGCFMYKGNRRHEEGTSNRFIYWRTSNDVVELVEVSLDVNLGGNHLRLRFQHTPVLQGMSIQETTDHVVILVSTVSTIHKLSFNHPRKLHLSSQILKTHSAVLPSVFYDASADKLRDHSCHHVLNHASVGAPLPHTSCSWLLPGGDAAFVLANSAGSHLLVVMAEKDEGKVLMAELKKSSVVSRLWNGLLRTNQSSDVALSIVCHQDTKDAYIFSLCRDLRIRMWSQNKQECLMTHPVFEYHEENGNTPSYNAQQCFLKKSVGTLPNECYLGVYISLPQQNQFSIFQPLYSADQFHLSLVATLYHKKMDLVDFSVTSFHLWTLWLNSDSQPAIKLTMFESENGQMKPSLSWLTMDLEPPLSRNIYIPLGSSDCKEIYLKEIFHQGRFSPSTISKAINIFRRTADTSFSSATSLKGSLKEETIKAVENEILARTREVELTDEEYQDWQIDCWDRFFSYCIQYHEVGTKPLGLSYDPTNGCVLVIKKSIYSILRPCDFLEQLMYTSSNLYGSPSYCLNGLVKEDAALCSSILVIFQCLRILQNDISDDMMKAFEHEMFQLSSPDTIASELIKDIQTLPGDPEGTILYKLHSQLNMASNIIPALKHLLQLVDLSARDESIELDDMDLSPFTEYPHFLNGTAGLSLLCESVGQFIRRRFLFCRDLLLLELLIIKLGESIGISWEAAGTMESEIIPHTRLLVQAYFALKWCTECEFVSKQSTALESELRQLSLLDISDFCTSPTSVKATDDAVGKTIVYYFLADQGRTDAYTLLCKELSYEEFCEKKWTSFVSQLITNAVKLLWPLGPYFHFPQFLLTQGQYIQLQGYVRLLQKWCEWNSYSLQFLSANCCLILGDHWKALKLFIQVAEGVEKEDYLLKKIMLGVDFSLSIVAQYYMKVIQLFEHFGLSECIIELAVTVLGILEKNDPHVPTFWSLVFKHHLELGHNEQAYTALTRNPDPSRQKDCLRQMIVVLCERRQFQTLIEFPYMDMQEDVVNILESRARSSDLLRQNFYDLLYAFHMHSNNFRKAACIMYEYGMRLGQELNSLESLQKQSSCFLVSINCLNLVDPKYAWIVKPVPKVTVLADGSNNENPGMSPKRNSDGEEIHHTSTNIHRNIEVLEVGDIRRECELICARLMLVQKDTSEPNIAVTPLSAVDCTALLISAGEFDLAIKLCKLFSLDLRPVFEGLTYRCITFTEHKHRWFKDDETICLDSMVQSENTGLQNIDQFSGPHQQWLLLGNYLKEHEAENQTTFHRCIASRVLSLGFDLPLWLQRSYQNRNPSELLYLYINYGLMENATKLAMSYIDAALGQGSQSFNIKYPLMATNPPVWLPHSYIDALLDALQEEVDTSKLYEELSKKVEEYNEKVVSMSENTLMTI